MSLLTPHNPKPAQNARALLQSDQAYATSLLVLLLDRYGPELYDWAPDTIRREVRHDFGIELHPENLDKIMAGISLVTTDAFFKSLPRFITICNVLADSGFDADTLDPADCREMVWAITEAMLLFEPDEPEPFNDEIRAYIGHRIREEGFANAPDVLGIAIGHQSLDPGAEFADDPALFQAFYEKQTADAEELTEIVRENLLELAQQLSTLTLENGDTTELVSKIRKQLAPNQETLQDAAG